MLVKTECQMEEGCVELIVEALKKSTSYVAVNCSSLCSFNHCLCLLCFEEWGHVKTDKLMDKKQVASLYKALMKNRRLNGLYLRGLNTPQQKHASRMPDVMNGTML